MLPENAEPKGGPKGGEDKQMHNKVSESQKNTAEPLKPTPQNIPQQ